jgi:hypothetical protein
LGSLLVTVAPHPLHRLKERSPQRYFFLTF